MKILCVFGKFQYGKEERGLSTEYFSFLPAIESLGHEVLFFDSWDKSLFQNFKELNLSLVEFVANHSPDIIFSVQLGYEIWIETWEYIRANLGCKTINWCTDDNWKYKEHSKFLASHFDLMVTTYEEFIPFYKAQNAEAFLSHWAAPIAWIQEPKKANDCKYKVTFVGAAHGDRKLKIKKLKEFGIEVECFGYGWNNGAVKADEIPRIFNDSIISLNFANSSGDNQIKARVFEVTGSGGFLISENAKNLDNFLGNKEIVIFEDLQESANKIQFYLKNLDMRDEMVKHSFQKVSQNYTYKEVVQNILDKARVLPKKRVQPIDFEKVLKCYRNSFFLKIIKFPLVFLGMMIFGRDRGKRFARRVVYEISWRIAGEKTFKSGSIIGRMFYEE